MRCNIMEDVWSLLSDLKGSTKQSRKDGLCENCQSDDVILGDGNYICRACQCLTSRFIDSSAEWRFYGNDDGKADPSRCGMPVNNLLPDSSLGSIISCQMYESPSMRLVRKYHMWNAMTYKERSLYSIFDSITVAAINHGISPSIVEEAKNLYKKLSESKISRGDNRRGLIASSIYMSCKINKVPRSAKEIAKIFDIKTTTMTKGCKKFQDLIKIDLESTNAEHFIERFCSKLFLSVQIREMCKSVIQKCDELDIVSSNTPPSLAAATIFLCAHHGNVPITKKQISESCDISLVTLTKCHKKLSEYKNILLPQDST